MQTYQIAEPLHELQYLCDVVNLKDCKVRNSVIPTVDSSVLESIQKLMSPHGESGHGFLHVLRVMYMAREALKVTRVATEFEMLCVLLACLLHDADDPKIFKTQDYANARHILAKHHMEKYIPTVIDMISLVSCSKNLDGYIADELWRIPRDCDRLDATGKIGIVRAYQFTVDTKRPLFLSTTPRITCVDDVERLITREAFCAYRERNGKSSSMLDHYFDKLLWIAKNFESTNFYLIQGATERYKDMMEYVIEFGKTGKVECPKFAYSL